MTDEMREAHIAGLNEGIRLYVAELKTAYAERDEARMLARSRWDELGRVRELREAAIIELAAVTAERDRACMQRGFYKSHLDVLRGEMAAEVHAARDRDEAVRADERREVLNQIREFRYASADWAVRSLEAKYATSLGDDLPEVGAVLGPESPIEPKEDPSLLTDWFRKDGDGRG